ncbi:MAG: hypothetical protein JJW01_00460 [Alphaproteobacteria bacterium]|nr:hypothetical protein [Rickettsiales bacterium]
MVTIGIKGKKSSNRFTLLILVSACTAVVFCSLPNAISIADDGKTDKPQKESLNIPSVKGPIQTQLLLKPFLIFGYNVQEIFSYNNYVTAPFFTELSQFQNWRIGLGFRITSFLAIELAYNSLARTYDKAAADPNDPELAIKMFGHMGYAVGTFYTPAIDLKFGTLEFTASLGMAVMFGLDHTNSANDNLIASTSSGPQFMGGVGVVLGFPKLISARGFVEIVTLGNNVMDIPFAMNYGIAINVYLL